MSRAGHRVLVDPEIGHEHAAGDVLEFAARGDHRHAVDLRERREVGRDRAHRGFVGDFDDRRVVAAVGQPHRDVRQAERARTAPARCTSASRAAGRSSSSRSPRRLTVSTPGSGREAHRLRRSSGHGRPRCVAWPHSSTSSAGVNQRRSISASSLSLGTVKAVSLRLFSAAIACISASSSQRSSGITAAGLPVSGRSAKASTWKNGMLVMSRAP